MTCDFVCFADVLVIKDLIKHASGKKKGNSYFLVGRIIVSYDLNLIIFEFLATHF